MPSITITDEYCDGKKGLRLDVFLSSVPEIASRNQAQKLIKAEKIKINGAMVNLSKHILNVGDKILFEDVESDLPPENIIPVNAPLEVHHEDEDILVVFKPAGLATHPSAGHYDNSLVHWLINRFKLAESDELFRPGIVHRLDMDTSGLLVIAKTKKGKRSMGRQFKEHSITRKYFALVWGCPDRKNGVIDKSIGINPVNRKKKGIDPDGRDAITEWEMIAQLYPCSLIKCTLQTGRTHQIRVHLSSIGYPLIGDKLYGTGKKTYKEVSQQTLDLLNDQMGQLLHAYLIGFDHPVSGERMFFYRRPPKNFLKILDTLDFSWDSEEILKA